MSHTNYNQRKIQEIVDILLDANDGPVKEHTVIARSVDLIKGSTYDDGCEIGAAMYQALSEIKEYGGYIPSNEFSNARAL